MLKKWCGVYRFDPEKTAHVLADLFKDRFAIKEGFEHAVSECLGENDEEVAQIRLEIRPDCILMRDGSEEARFPVLGTWQEAGHTHVEVDWHGQPQRFEIQEFDGGCIRLHNPSNSLSENVWKPVEPGSE